VSGDLVKQITADITGTAKWDAKNENADDVASGVYYVLLSGTGGNKTMKVAVQR